MQLKSSDEDIYLQISSVFCGLYSQHTVEFLYIPPLVHCFLSECVCLFYLNFSDLIRVVFLGLSLTCTHTHKHTA